MMFKYLLGIVLKPIKLLFTRNNEIHNHNTRYYSNLLCSMIERTETTYKTVRSQAILIWNYISKELPTCFKKTSLI